MTNQLAAATRMPTPYFFSFPTYTRDELSIDESVMAALTRKDKVQEALMSAVKAELGRE